MTTFADALDSTETRKGPQCSVCRLLRDLEPGADRDAIKTALASDRMQSHVARALAVFTGDNDWLGRGAAVGRHRTSHLDR